MKSVHVEIFREARKIIKKHGVINLSRWELCEAVGIPPGSFAHAMGYGFDKFVKILRKEEIPEPMHGVSVEKTRTNPALRKENILQVAMVVAVRRGYTDFTRADLAEAAGVSAPLINHYFHNMKTLQRIIMRRAVEQRVIPIIIQGLTRKDLIARRAPEELRAAALVELTKRELKS